jgi:phage tail-like protein
MGVLSKPRRLQQKWKYTVEVDGFASHAFNKCSAIEWETGDVEHWEGGNVIAHKEPGRVTVTDVTLDRGVGLDGDMHDWALECIDFTKNGGQVPQDLKRNLDVVERARDGSEVKRTTCFNAYPKKYVFGEYDSDADEVVVEQLVLRYDYPQDTTNT